MSVLDYLSDYICCLWGKPGAYGVVTMPFSVREGINIFLDGFVPTENLRFREESLNFKLSADQDILPEEIQVSLRHLHITSPPFFSTCLCSLSFLCSCLHFLSLPSLDFVLSLAVHHPLRSTRRGWRRAHRDSLERWTEGQTGRRGEIERYKTKMDRFKIDRQSTADDLRRT